jgi:hypothetical protein
MTAATMRGVVRLLIPALAVVHQASSFSIPDSFHVIQAAQTVATHSSHAIPHFDPLESYKQLLSAHPLPTKMMTGATLAVTGDAIAQSQDKTSDYDTRRASSFAVFDMAYRALQHYSFPIIVAACHGQYIGSIPGAHVLDVTQLSAIEQTLASQLGIVPFMYYPAFFALTGAVQGLSVSGAVTRAQENFLPLMKRNLLFWLPMQFIQFGYVPEDLQIPFLSVCGLFWTFIISAAAGSTKNYTPEKEMEDAVIRNAAAATATLETDETTASSIPRGAADATSY